MTTQSIPKLIPFNSIYIPEEENARTDIKPKDVEKLAADIKERGLIEPLVVTNGGTGEQVYRLHAGFRRAAALKFLKWGSKEIAVVVRDEWCPLVTAAENFLREGWHPIDTAQYCWGLFNSDYNAPESHVRRKHSDEEIGRALNLGKESARNLRRVHERLSGDVRKLARKHGDVPLRLLIECCANEMGEEIVEENEETGEKTKSWVPNDAKQLAVFNRWLKKNEENQAAGRTRAKRGEGGSSEGGGTGDGTTYKRKPPRIIEACVKILNRKKADDPAYAHYAQALRFASGETDKLPGITKDELEEQVAKMKEAAKAGKEAE